MGILKGNIIRLFRRKKAPPKTKTEKISTPLAKPTPTPLRELTKETSKVQTVGGMTTIGGESVLVTPSGEQVGSAGIPGVDVPKSGGGQFTPAQPTPTEPTKTVIPTVTKPTPIEETLKQSLAREIPGKPTREGFSGGFGGGSAFMVTLPPKKLPTRTQELTTGSTLLGATKQSLADIEFKTIGREGFDVFVSDIFKPFSDVSVSERPDISPGLFTTGRGTQITDEAFVPTEFKTTAGLSRAETIERQRFIAGESIETLRTPPKIAGEIIGKGVKEEILPGIQQEFETKVGGEVGVLQKEFQGKIDTGELTLGQAQTQFDIVTKDIVGKRQEEFQTKFTTEFGTAFEERAGKFTEGRVRSEEIARGLEPPDLGKGLQLGAEVGSFVAVSTTPFGLAATSQIIGTSIASESFGRAVLGKDIGLGTRTKEAAIGTVALGAGGLFTRTALGPQTAIIKGVEGGGIRAPSSLFEKQFQKEILKDLAKQKTVLIGPQPTQDAFGISTLELGGGRQLAGGLAREDIRATIKATDVGKGQFQVFGKGVSKVTTKSVFGETIELPATTFKIRPSLRGPIQTTKPQQLVEEIGGLQIKDLGKETTGAFGFTGLEITGKKGVTTPFVSIAEKGPVGVRILSGKAKTAELVRLPKFKLEVTKEGTFFKQAIGVGKVKGQRQTLVLIPSGKPIQEADFIKKTIRFTEEKPIRKALDKDVSSLLGQKIEQKLKPRIDLAAPIGVAAGGAVSKVPLPSIKTVAKETLVGPGAFPAMKQRPSAFAGTGQFELTTGGLAPPGFKSIQVDRLEPKTTFVSGLKPSFKELDVQKIKPGVLFGVRETTSPLESQRFRPALLEGQRLKAPLKAKLKSEFIPPPFFDVARGFDFGGRFLLPPLPFLPPLGQEIIKKRKKGKRKFRRRPSLIAAELGLFAERPAPLEVTGLVTRPLIR